MLRKLRRQLNKAKQLRKSTPDSKSTLKFEPLENRLLLDVAGYWSELGYRSASGGGVSWDSGVDHYYGVHASGTDVNDRITEGVGGTQVITTEDGDAVVFWVEGQLIDELSLDAKTDPVPYSYDQIGLVNARQFAGEDLGWWDLGTVNDTYDIDEDGNVAEIYNSGDSGIVSDNPYLEDDETLLAGTQIEAVSGPNGTIILTGIRAQLEDVPDIARDGQIYQATDQVFVMIWDGSDWEDITYAFGTDTSVNLVDQASKPSVAVNDAGEIFISYTAEFPDANQSDIVVMKYGFSYGNNNVGTPLRSDLGWTELISTEVGEFTQTPGQITGGASNSNGNSFDSAITVDNTGKPVVVWTEADDEVNTEIFVKGWDGNSWEELGENSASFNDVDGNFGISSNSYQDLQPDIAINEDGDIIVTWVSWQNWTNYTTDGEAGVFVRYLPGDDTDGAWRGYDFVADGLNVASDEDAGVAQGNNVPVGRAGLGWYYQPEITLDSSGNAAISWFGWGESENRAVDRNDEVNPPEIDDPYWGVFVSYYYDNDDNSATADTFEVLFEDYDETTYEWDFNASPDHTNVQRAVAGEPDKLAWAPTVTFVGEGNDEKLIFGYVQEDRVDYYTSFDREVFVKYWDGDSWEEYGLGASENGNPELSSYPVDADLKDSDIAYFEFNSISTDNYDVVMAIPDFVDENAGQMYVYDRQSGEWSTSEPLTAGGDDINDIDHDSDGVFGFGRIFDLKGEPEIEYSNIENGNPLLAFLDDTDGLPYVYQYSIAGGWEKVGTNAAGTQAGNFDFDSDDTGISVQMGSDGSILLAYVATNQNGTIGVTSDDFDYVVTRLYNPNTLEWEDADIGELTKASVLEATYFADFDGYDFDEVGDLSDGDFDDDNNRIYENGEWYFWPGIYEDFVSGEITNYDDADLTTGYNTGRLHVWSDPDENDPIEALRQGAMEIAFNFPENSTQQLVMGEIDQQFELIDDGDIIIEFDASLDPDGKFDSGVLVEPFFDKDIYLYLTIDGQYVDVNVNDDAISSLTTPMNAINEDITPVAVVKGDYLTDDYMPMTSFKFDSTELYDNDGNLIELEGGEHRIGFRAFAIDNNNATIVDLEQNGAVRIDNVVIYQRIIADSRFVSGDTSTFNAIDPIGGGVWSVDDVDANVTIVHEEGAGRSGDADDDALMMTLTNAHGNTLAASGEFIRDYNLTEDGYVRIDFDYKIETDSDFGVDDVVDLQVWVDLNGNGTLDAANNEWINYDSDSDATLSTYTVTGPDGDSNWVRVSLVSAVEAQYVAAPNANTVHFIVNVNDNGGADVGEAVVYIDNVDVSHSLTLADATNIFLNDNSTVTDSGNWVYSEADLFGNIDTSLNLVDECIDIEIEGGADSSSYGDVGYAISTPISLTSPYFSYISLDFDYRITLAAGPEGAGDVSLGDYGALQLYLVEDSNSDGILNPESDNLDTYMRISDDGLYRYYSDGDNDGDSGWVSVSDAKVGPLYTQNGVVSENGVIVGPLASNNDYFLVFRGLLSDSTNNEAGTSTISIDNISIKYTGYTQWENDEMFNGDTGGNNAVGPDPDGNGIPVYPDRFRGDLHASNIFNDDIGVQSQMFTVPDYYQTYTGDAKVSFRYHWREFNLAATGYPDLTDVRLLVDGVEYDADFHMDEYGWYDGVINNPKYSLVEITIPDLELGSHNISIELVGATNLWIDNLLIQGTSSLVDTINPIVKLGAVGQNGERPYIVGATYVANEMQVYPTEDATISGKYNIENFIDYDNIGVNGQVYTPRNFLADAYHYAALYELNNNTWEQYGTTIMSTANVNFLVVPGANTINPSNELFYLQDFAAGPDQLQWVLVENATTELVDVTGNDDFEFHGHPWNSNNPPDYWGDPTSLTTEIWTWDITDEDDNNRAQWTIIDEPMTQYRTEAEYRVFRNAQIISGPSQKPIIAWTDYNGWRQNAVSHAVRYVGTGGVTWEAVGPSADGDIQNGYVTWGATTLHEMIRDESGSPLIAYSASHLDIFAIREFVTALEDADAVIVDMDDTGGDLVLDYGVVEGGRVAEKFSVTNVGQGDLYVQDISFGGFGAADGAFNITNDPGLDTEALILESGETYVFNIEFDPNTIPSGAYQGVIVVQTNEGQSDIHPFDNFQEIIVNVEVANDGDIVIEDDQGNRTDRYVFFDDATINRASGNWQTQVITVRNEGTDDLDIYDLVYTGAGFEIIEVVQGNNVIDFSEGYFDTPYTLGVEESMQITVGFNPKEALLYDETIYIVSNDTSEPIVPVRMLGYGLTGGDIRIETSIYGTQWTTVWASNVPGSDDIDEVLELGSTVWGQTDDTPLRVRIYNTGTTTLLLEDVHLQSGTSEVAFSPDSRISDIEIEPGDFYPFEMTYSPNTGNVQDITTDLLFLSENLFILTDSSDEDDAEISLAVEGYAVPEAPVVQIVDAETGEVISGWIPEAGVIVDASQGLDMGVLNLGTGSIGANNFSKTLIIRNIGGEDLTVEALQVGYVSPQGDSISDYALSRVNMPGNNADDFIVEALNVDEDEFSVTITYTPTITGEKTALFRLDYSKDWNGDGVENKSQVFVELYSEVTDQGIVVSDDDGKNNTILDFGKVGSGNTSEFNIIVSNTGETELTITNWMLLDVATKEPIALDNPFSVNAFEDSFAISGNGTQEIPVNFSPVLPDGVVSEKYDVILRIFSDDAGQTANPEGDDYYVDYIISGQGVTPGGVGTYPSADAIDEIETLDFGSVLYGDVWSDGNGEVRQYFVVRNNGEAVIDLTRIYTDNNLFTIFVNGVAGGLSSTEDVDDVTLQPDESIIVGVSFAATQAYFDTSIPGVGLQHVYIEYDDMSGDEELQLASVGLQASVVMTSNPSTDSGDNNKVVWSDNDGDLITIQLIGPGSFEVKAVSTTNNDIGVIELSGTTTGSTLKIIGSRGNLYDCVVGAILGPNGTAIQELGSIYMKYVDIDGDQGEAVPSGQDPADVGDGLVDRQYAINIETIGSKLFLGDILGQADIYIGDVEKTSGLAVTTGSISEGSDIVIEGDVRSFVVKPSVAGDEVDVMDGSVTIGGDMRSFALKWFNADITTDFTIDGDTNSFNISKARSYTGKAIFDGDLGSFNMPGGSFEGELIADNLSRFVVDDMINGKVAVQSIIKSVTMNDDMIDSFILSGVNVGDEVGGADDTLVGGSEIKRVTIKGKFTDSNILAGVSKNISGNYDVFGDEPALDTASGSVGNVKFGYIEFGDDLDEFGIGAGSSINSLRTRLTPRGSINSFRSFPVNLNLDDNVDGDEFFVKII